MCSSPALTALQCAPFSMTSPGIGVNPCSMAEHPHQEARRRRTCRALLKCLGCLIDVNRLAQFEAEPQPCDAQAEASVVTSNAITGALMAWMLQEMVDSRLRRGVWEYDGRARDTRVGVHSVRLPATVIWLLDTAQSGSLADGG